ncbi:MAG: hypothetical protein R3C51_04605 [Parvularculaceae bacterium]
MDKIKITDKFTITRRQAMIGGGAAGAVALTGAAVVATSVLAGAVARIVRNRLPGVEISRADLDRYVADFAAARAPFLREKATQIVLRGQSFFLNGAVRAMLPRDARRKLLSFEGQILTPLLLGSNFFLEDEPPAKLEYFAYPDPQTLKCANPLARYDFD